MNGCDRLVGSGKLGSAKRWFRRACAWGVGVALAGSHLLCGAPPIEGVSVAERARDDSVAAEKASFRLADGYAVNLFASEADGIANPIAMRWDPAGRLWVLTTLAYAQLEPGQVPDDRLIVLEDTDGDGRADSSSVWADGLDMPTGFALGHGGVYLAEGESLWFLEDADGDGRADRREMVLSGFGTGDTHQNINSLSWGPAGDVWFSQGLHNLSRVETPWGIVRGEEAGFFRLRVRELRLEPFCMHGMASQNPWGINWERWGAMFVKSNNRELGYVSPGIIPTSHVENLMKRATVAVTPGKSMGCEFVESSHLPEGLQRHVLIAGYFANQVTAFPLRREGAGFAQTEGWKLLRSESPSFRPVEVKVGPDGAVYVADWYNPIIGHYQASLRHPDRDRTHGRVWRITARDRPLATAPDLVAAPVERLLRHLGSGERWVREQARAELRHRGADAVLAKLEPLPDAVNPHHEYELILLRQELRQGAEDRRIRAWMERPEGELRVAAARALGRWHATLEEPLPLLETAIADADPQVRMEAIVAASHLGRAEAMRVALRALDRPRDHFLNYALRQAVHALAPRWIPALQEGTLTFDSPRHVAFAASVVGGGETDQLLRSLVEDAAGQDRAVLGPVVADEDPAVSALDDRVNPADRLAVGPELAPAVASDDESFPLHFDGLALGLAHLDDQPDAGLLAGRCSGRAGLGHGGLAGGLGL